MVFIERSVFSPQRSGGLFIEFCQHEVPSLPPCRLEANSFADSRHGTNGAGRSPIQNVFLSFSSSPNPIPKVTKTVHYSLFT